MKLNTIYQLGCCDTKNLLWIFLYADKQLDAAFSNLSILNYIIRKDSIRQGGVKNSSE
jgi:hypothetical protein